MLKNLFCEEISAEYEFKSEKFKGCTDRLKLLNINNSDLSGNTLEFKTLITDASTLTSIYIVLYIPDGIR